MKKLSVLLLSLVLSLVIVSAISTTLKSEYRPRQTLIAEISGNFIDNINIDNIQFYSNRTFIPMISDIAKIQDKYYLYAVLPNVVRDYTLKIKDAHFMELGEEVTKTLEFNFSVKGNYSSFSVNPGFIVTNKDFKITVNPIDNINIQSIFSNTTQSFTTMLEKKIDFSISSLPQTTLTYATLSSGDTSYIIPVYVLKNTTKTTSNIQFSYSNFTVLKNNISIRQIYLSNIGNTDIEDIQFNYPSLRDIIFISPERISLLRVNETQMINITILSLVKEDRQGILKAFSSNTESETPIYISTLDNETQFNTIVTVLDSCAQINGKQCASNEVCSGELKTAINCCIGTCTKKSTSNSGKIFGIILVVVLLALIGFFMYRRLKLRKTTSKEIINENAKSYEERFKPREERDSLTRT